VEAFLQDHEVVVVDKVDAAVSIADTSRSSPASMWRSGSGLHTARVRELRLPLERRTTSACEGPDVEEEGVGGDEDGESNGPADRQQCERGERRGTEHQDLDCQPCSGHGED
jgi:hypothetical protein